MPDASNRPMVRNQRAGQLRDYERQRAKLEAKGLDPSKFLPPPVQIEGTLQLEDLPEYSARVEQEISQARDELEVCSEKAMAESGMEGSDLTDATGRRRFDPDQMIEELARLEEFGASGPT